MRHSLGVSVVVFVVLSVVLNVHHTGMTAAMTRERMRLAAAIDPPKRPNSFTSLTDLNEYLKELKQYYTLLGRPR